MPLFLSLSVSVCPGLHSGVAVTLSVLGWMYGSPFLFLFPLDDALLQHVEQHVHSCRVGEQHLSRHLLHTKTSVQNFPGIKGL